MKIKFLWITIVVMILLLAATLAASPKKTKQGMCHVCHCTQKAEECIKECNSPKLCVIACTHDCKMKAVGIKKCPLPQTKEAEGRSPYLTQFYDDMNVKYFSARLPDVPITDNKDKNSPDLGETIPCGDHCYDIIIYSSLVPDANEQKMVVLHEMCHVDLNEADIEEFNQHGPTFQACMLRLAEKGAFADLW